MMVVYGYNVTIDFHILRVLYGLPHSINGDMVIPFNPRKLRIAGIIRRANIVKLTENSNTLLLKHIHKNVNISIQKNVSIFFTLNGRPFAHKIRLVPETGCPEACIC